MNLEIFKQRIFVLQQLTKRELKRKYARSYLGVLWSIGYPLLRMFLVVMLFSTLLSRNIAKYPAYYFVGFLMLEFFKTGSENSLTALVDNKMMFQKTKIVPRIFVLSRVLTSFVNLLLGTIPFIGVLIFYGCKPTLYLLYIPIDIFFLALFVTGMSYAVSIWYLYMRDAKFIYSNALHILRFFTALYYSIDRMPHNIATFIRYNPPYTFIAIGRNCIVYGKAPDEGYLLQMVVYGIGFYIFGKVIFELFKHKIAEKM